jgi:flavin reductase (DIM6/NTAB) family NADH-FMN oxidoreductase RutF
MNVNPATITPKDTYKLLSGSVVPRPIAWVSTVDAEGGFNLAPFSFFTVASRNPPMLCISVGPGTGEREGTIKDTLHNITLEKEFVINIVSSELGNQMQTSAENFAPEINEFESTGLTPIPSNVVKAPRVDESPISMECVLEQIIDLGSDHLVIGRMVHFHVKDEFYLGNFKIDIEKMKPLGRLAGNYSEITDLFNLPR